MLCFAGFAFSTQRTTHIFFENFKKEKKCQYKLLLQM
jgi:hypothetical protein